MSVTMSVAEGVARIVIDRPERRGALTAEMRQALGGFVDAASEDPAVRTILLTGTAGHFCAGADLEQFGEEGLPASRQRMRRGGHRIARGLHGADKPVVAAVGGPAIGLGWSLALACDLIVASESARFGMTFARVGLVPDTGAAYFLARQIGLMRAKELVFSGRIIDSAEAQTLGLVNRVVPDDRLEAEAAALSAQLAEGPTFALGLAKQMFHAALGPGLSEFLEIERLVGPQLRFTDDLHEGTRAFRERRSARFSGR